MLPKVFGAPRPAERVSAPFFPTAGGFESRHEALRYERSLFPIEALRDERSLFFRGSEL